MSEACRRSATFDWPRATRSDRSRSSSRCRLRRIGRWTAAVVRRRERSCNGPNYSSINIGVRRNYCRWTHWPTSSRFIRAHCERQRVTVDCAYIYRHARCSVGRCGSRAAPPSMSSGACTTANGTAASLHRCARHNRRLCLRTLPRD